MNTKTDEAEALAKERVILKLFRLYRSLDGKATRALIDSYLTPVAECSLSAIQQAFERIESNEVPDADPKWPVNVPVWVSQVKMLDSILKRVTKGGDGLTIYRIGSLPPPGTEPLGPIKLEVDGRLRDVSHLSAAEKETVLKTGRMPETETPRLRSMK